MPNFHPSMPTVSSVALGGLQVVALLAAVVVAGSRLLIAGLDPTSDEDVNYWMARIIAYSSIVSLITLSVAGILFTLGLMSAYAMPAWIDLAFLLLLAGLAAFSAPMALLIYHKWNQDKLPSLESP